MIKNLRLKDNGDIKYLTRVSDDGTKMEGEDIRIVRLRLGTHKLGTDIEYDLDPQKRLTVTYGKSRCAIDTTNIYDNKIIVFFDRYRILPEIISVSTLDDLKSYLKNHKKYNETEIAIFAETYVLEVI